MGNPMNGDIYEGMLRPGDVGLSEKEVEYFRNVTLQDRMTEFKRMFEVQGARATGTDNVTREMPRYKSHKEVWALKIAEIRVDRPTFSGLVCRGSYALGTACGNCEQCKWEREHGNALQVFTIFPQDEGYAPFSVDAAFMAKHKPDVGGYFVVYKDGYKSYSPAKAFEEGYTRI